MTMIIMKLSNIILALSAFGFIISLVGSTDSKKCYHSDCSTIKKPKQETSTKLNIFNSELIFKDYKEKDLSWYNIWIPKMCSTMYQSLEILEWPINNILDNVYYCFNSNGYQVLIVVIIISWIVNTYRKMYSGLVNHDRTVKVLMDDILSVITSQKDLIQKIDKLHNLQKAIKDELKEINAERRRIEQELRHSQALYQSDVTSPVRGKYLSPLSKQTSKMIGSSNDQPQPSFKFLSLPSPPPSSQ